MLGGVQVLIAVINRDDVLASPWFWTGAAFITLGLLALIAGIISWYFDYEAATRAKMIQTYRDLRKSARLTADHMEASLEKARELSSDPTWGDFRKKRKEAFNSAYHLKEDLRRRGVPQEVWGGISGRQPSSEQQVVRSIDLLRKAARWHLCWFPPVRWIANRRAKRSNPPRPTDDR